MTTDLLDEYAKAALTGLCANTAPEIVQMGYGDMAEEAFKIARQMLLKRDAAYLASHKERAALAARSAGNGKKETV